ncbi:MAG: PAS domain S-box protein [Alphaproteobacteria bacterium]|nr:PAS domain S-box protein [Alphaproteobacteria bacterium]
MILRDETALEELLERGPAVTYTCQVVAPYAATFISANVEAQTGYPAEDFTADSGFWTGHIHPDDQQRVSTGLEALLDGDHHIHEYRFRHRDGQYLWMRDELNLLRDAKGEPEKIVGFWIDITKQKDAQEELRQAHDDLEKRVEERTKTLQESEERFRILVQGQSDLICRNDIEGNLSFVNEAYCQYFGESAEELVGSNFLHLLPEKFHAQALEHLASLSPDSPSATHEHEVLTPSGERRWQQWTNTASFDRDGRATEVVAVGRDITERKRAEDFSTRMGRILENSFNEIFFFDAETLCFTQVNRGARENLGYSPEEFALLTPVDIKPQFTAEAFAELLVPLRSGKERLLRFETVHRRKDGSTYDVSVKLQLSSEESPPIFVAIIEDITERKQAEEALRESEKRFQEMAHNVPGIVYQFMMDPSEKPSFPYVGPTIQNYFGLEARDVMSDPTLWIDLIHPDDREDFDLSVETSWKNLSSWLWEGRFLLPSGRIVWIQGNSKPRRLEDGSVLWNGIVTDITRRKRAEEEIVGRNRVLEDLVSGKPLKEVLQRIVNTAERLNPENAYSILLVTEDGKHLIHGAAGTISKDYQEAIEGMPIGLGEGSCGHVAMTGQPVIAEDVQTHPYWENYKGFAAEAGFRACWSIPLMSTEGEVLGTFATYSKPPGLPSENVMANNRVSAAHAAIAVERKRAEEALQRSENQLKDILDHSPAVVYIKDTEGCYLFVNRQYEVLFDQTDESIRGKTDYDIFEKRFADVFRKNDLEVMNKKAPVHIEETVPQADGIHTYITVKFPLINSKGDIYAVCGISTDITERKQKERELEEKTQFLLQAEQLGKIGHWIVYAKTGQLYWSDEIYRIHGLEPGCEIDVEAAIGAYHPDDREAVVKHVRRAME